MMGTDAINWKAHALVEKYDPDQTRWAQRKSGLLAPPGDVFKGLGLIPVETVECPDNLLCNNGINRLWNFIIGTASIVGYTNSTARIGTGDGAGTAAASDTDLSASAGSTHRWFQAMDATYPQVSAQTATFKSTFASADGNYAWNEWGIDGNGASGNTVGVNDATHAALLNHKTSAALGTKASGATWAFTATIALS